jgi:hypothetical protein
MWPTCPPACWRSGRDVHLAQFAAGRQRAVQQPAWADRPPPVCGSGKTLTLTPVGPRGCDGTDYVTGSHWRGTWTPSQRMTSQRESHTPAGPQPPGTAADKPGPAQPGSPNGQHRARPRVSSARRRILPSRDLGDHGPHPASLPRIHVPGHRAAPDPVPSRHQLGVDVGTLAPQLCMSAAGSGGSRARRSTRGNQPDRPGHNRCHRQDPQQGLMRPLIAG